MNGKEKEYLIDLISATSEVIGSPLKPTAVMMMVEDLTEYPFDDIKKALNLCRKECKGRLTLADIIERLTTGLPSADEMFAQIAEWCLDETKTFVLPEIAFRACEETNGGVYDALMAGDRTGARMAYKASYARLAKAHTGELSYVIRTGTDREQSEAVILDAIKQGKLEQKKVQALLPNLDYDGVGVSIDGTLMRKLPNKRFAFSDIDVATLNANRTY